MGRLKRWESPRREGRNDKGKGGSARQRQLKKRTQMLRKKLKQNDIDNKQRGSGSQTTSPIFLATEEVSWGMEEVPHETPIPGTVPYSSINPSPVEGCLAQPYGAGCQSFTVLSNPPLTRVLPSGLKAIARTASGAAISVS